MTRLTLPQAHICIKRGRGEVFRFAQGYFGKRHEKPSAKPGTKGRWPKGKANRVPRVKVLNYLKKVALFFRFERDILTVSHRLTLTVAELQLLRSLIACKTSQGGTV